ncbi:hypothetical protein OD91_1553 [Lutibacter sp. Hel_I_33_5]|uniref:DUF6341 family protein n=1 Tax=Lutibacter sp. Hel_I_33_5 TaxID=1566289 RepID=UPI00119E6714|nr:hypothetical protein [Lutibacter sp. Hel_I_33_5]TVZ56271.1 hypothetical protein OD91_1553 [Lutibacter sp. Hel_I_33_5]
MIAGNIFRWIGDFFKWTFSFSFDMLRLDLATKDAGWWISNVVNWLFLVVLLVLFWYWMKESARFVKEGTEDRA